MLFLNSVSVAVNDLISYIYTTAVFKPVFICPLSSSFSLRIRSIVFKLFGPSKFLAWRLKQKGIELFEKPVVYFSIFGLLKVPSK